MTRILVFEEPHDSGGDCRVTMTEAQAIEWSRKILEKIHPNKGPFSDKNCLDEFIVIHYAWYENE